VDYSPKTQHGLQSSSSRTRWPPQRGSICSFILGAPQSFSCSPPFRLPYALHEPRLDQNPASDLGSTPSANGVFCGWHFLHTQWPALDRLRYRRGCMCSVLSAITNNPFVVLCICTSRAVADASLVSVAHRNLHTCLDKHMGTLHGCCVSLISLR